MKHVVAILLISLLSGQVKAQEKKNWVVRQLTSLAAFVDTMSSSGIDPDYIEVPKRPWQVILRYGNNDMTLRSRTTIEAEELARKGLYGEMNIESKFSPDAAPSVGLWVGYRGYGLGYNLSLSDSHGYNFSFGATGSRYSIRLRLRRFKANEFSVTMSGFDDEGDFNEELEAEVENPVTVHTTLIDGYYMLNGKRFSHAAAYDQSTIQRHSAGSLVLGASWFYTSLNYLSHENAILIMAMNNIARTQIYEGSIGIGYAYNWVPAKNLLVNVTAIPLLTLYNKAKVYRYESNYDVFLEPGEVSPDGKKPLPDDDSWMEDITLNPAGTATKHGNVSLNIDGRLSVTYQLGRCFLNVNGHLNHYNHRFGSNHMKITDWNINGLIGIRL